MAKKIAPGKYTGKIVKKSPNGKVIGKGKFVAKTPTFPYRINPRRVA